MATDLLNILTMIQRIADGSRLSLIRDYDVGDIMSDFRVSRATAYRWIEDAKHLGASIERFDGGLSVANYSEIGPRVERWIELERDKVFGGPLLCRDLP